MVKQKKDDNTKDLLKELDIKKEDLIEEIKNDIKLKLEDEISNRVNYEAKNKLEKMEKRIYKYKNRSMLKRNFLILILLGIIIFETKILYDNNLLSKLDNKDENNEIKQEMREDNILEYQKGEKDSNWYIKNYSYLLDNIKTNISDEDQYYLYKKDYTEDSIRNSIKLNMAYQLLADGIKSENNIIEVKEKDLKSAYEKIFGNIENFKSENFNDSCIQFIYNKETKNFMAIDTDCDEDRETIFRSIKKIYEEDDKLIIAVFIGVYNEEEKTLSTIDKKNIYNYKEENIANLPVYEFIFKRVDGKYYLNKINKGE